MVFSELGGSCTDTDFIQYQDISVQDAFEKIVHKYPDKAAIIEGEKILTYQQFNCRINKLTYYFEKQGITKGKRVVLIAEHCIDSVVTILALLKLGAIYVPVDPEWPKKRIEYIIEDCNADAVCCFGDEVYTRKTYKVSEIHFEHETDKNPGANATLEAPAYITYTSGTTGKPKGVVIPQKAIVKLKLNACYDLHFKKNDVVAQFSTMASTASVSELFFTFLTGSTLVLTTKENVINIKEYETICIKNKVNVLIVSPRYYMELNIPHVDRIITLGEATNTGILEKIPENAEYTNLYGTSETGGAALCWNWDKKKKDYKKLPIGKSVKNVTAYIVDNQERCAAGKLGELCIVTDGLMTGYLNLDDLSEQKISENPFGPGKLYHTGDKAMIEQDGNIIYLGRVDDQVNINGNRIELGEVENVIKNENAVTSCAVISRENHMGESELYAYLVSDSTIDIKELRQSLLCQIPPYMVPAYMVQIEKIPLTQNGKLDRNRLLEIQEKAELPKKKITFSSDVEEQLYKLYQDVLNVQYFDIESSFFEIGGQSLKAIRLTNRIDQVFHCTVTVQDIFRFPSVRLLAEFIAHQKKEDRNLDFAKAGKKEYYDVSSTQKRIYLVCEMEQTKLLYNLPRCFICKKTIDIEKIKRAYQEVIKRHEILRTSFIMKDGKLVQRVNEHVELPFEYIESSSLSDKELIADFVRPFDLAQESLVRMQVVNQKEDTVILINMHHIISDGTSYNNFIKEFNMLYAGGKLESLEYQYKDYCEWMNQRDLYRQKQYWLNELSGELPILNMPTDSIRKKKRSNNGKTLVKTDITKEFEGALRKFSREHNVTEYMVFLTAAMITLAKYTRQDDIVIGSVYSARTRKETENMLGMFANTLALRGKPVSSKSLSDFLMEIKDTCIQAYSNQDYPFDELVEQVDVNYDMSRNPIFDVMLVMENQEQDKIRIETDETTENEIILDTSKFDLTFYVYKKENTEIRLEYCSDLYKEDMAKLILHHYFHVVEELIRCDLNQKIEMIEMFDNQEKHLLMNEFNQAGQKPLSYDHILKQIEEQIKKCPEQIAVTEKDRVLSYCQLDEKSSYLANKLEGMGIHTQDYIVVICDKSIEWIIAFVAILKAGAIYVPVNPDTPMERIKYICDDCKSALILSQKGKCEELENTYLLENSEAWNCTNIEDGTKTTLDDIMYCIYTSGTTGRPKGVLQKISTISNLVAWEQAELEMECHNIATLASIGFDVSIQEISTALAMGCNLVVVSDELKKDISGFSRYITDKKIDTVFCTPSYWDAITSSIDGDCILNQIHTIILAGEAMYLNKKCLDSLLMHAYYNHYGPTETHVVTCLKFEQEEQRITIGKPIRNHTAYILKKGVLCGIGEPGELCIAGAGVAAGYLGNTELTEEKFVTLSFEERKIYRTGDMARWLPNGEIEYLGRVDRQTKIRGYRIELGEIESVIRSLSDVVDVAVIIRESTNHEKLLYAYLTANKGLEFDEMKNQLRDVLPGYMIPAYMMQIDRIPMTVNGKLDQSALPNMNSGKTAGVKAPTRNTEILLCDIFKQVLMISHIGIEQNFFDLGGHSLKAMKLVNLICESSGYTITIQDVFKYPTVESMAGYLDEIGRKKNLGITECEQKKFYSMSSTQKRIYLQSQMDETGVLYNIPGGFIVNEVMDANKAIQAIQCMIEHHEILRTTFQMKNDELVQNILEYIEESITVEADDRADEKEVLSEFIKPFDLTKAPLFRMKLIIRKKDTILLLDVHHSISDGTSYWNFLNEFFRTYRGEELALPKYQYRDYSEWMRKRDLADQREYWLSEFSGELPMINLPYDFPRPLNQSFEGKTVTRYSGSVMREKIKKTAAQNSATEYMVLLSAFIILLNKYSGQDDLIVGTPIANRIDINTENMLGMFANTLAIRVQLPSDATFADCLMIVKQKCLKAYQNQEYPFEQLVEELDIERDISRNPIFDVMFSFQDTNNQTNAVSELKAINRNREENKISKFDITLAIDSIENEYIFYFEYCSKIFEEKSIHVFAEHYCSLLTDIVNHPDKSIANLLMMSHDEIHRIVDSFNQTSASFPKKNLIDLFEKQVDKTPDAFCVEYEGRKLTYHELDIQANAIAKELMNYNVGCNTFVALYTERSIEMIVGLIAILKTGAAYIPIDAVYPLGRVQDIITDATPKAILTYGVPYEGELPCIDLFQHRAGVSQRIQRNSSLDDSLYMIYTSGTTGKSKGAVIKNNSFVNMVTWYRNEFELSAEDNIMLIASISFDLAQKNIFAPLLSGGCLFVYNQWNYDSDEITRAIVRNKITVINSASSVFYPIIYSNDETSYEKLETLRYLLLGGEIINKSIMKPWITSKNCNAELVNTYGPTECTDIASFYRCTKEDFEDSKPIPIGKPICNVKLYVLDQKNNLCGIGVPGELCIGGAGVSKGYWNKETVNKQKFIKSPFDEGRIYKTGDIVRWRSDGNIEFIGRADGQVKIRGFRIELHEIENKIKEQPEILDVAVIVKNDAAGEKNIYAYFVAKKKVELADLRNKLKEKLPVYMIPAYFMQLDILPITQNGKLNYRKLPEVSTFIESGYEAPESEIEYKLCEILEDILNVDKVGVSDNFFDRGGHSLRAARFVNQIEKEFKVKVSLKMIFQHPVVKELADILSKEHAKLADDSIPKAEEKEYYDMSSSQKRTYLNCSINENSTSYNSPYCIVMQGKVDVQKIKETVQTIINRHEILRTAFVLDSGRLLQKVLNHVESEFEYEKAGNISEEDAVKGFVRAFDLTRAPLFRVKIMERNNDYLMLWDIHHIVSDGVSIGIIIKEFNALYNGNEIPLLSHQYKDYSEWMGTRDISSQKEYWINTFADEIPVIDMPYDFIRKQQASFKGKIYTDSIEESLCSSIKELAQQSQVTVFMIFLSSFMILLKKYSRQEDIVIGSPISSRTHHDTEDMIGMFVNTLALRGKTEGSKQYMQFLHEIKEICLKAYENQQYPFEELVEELDIQRNISRNPLFDVMLTMQNTEPAELQLKNIVCKNVMNHNSIAKFDISMDINETDNRFGLVIEYAEELFTSATIKLLIDHYKILLESLVANPNALINEIPIMSDKEKVKVLEEFNDTAVPFDQNMFIMDYFEKQVERTPEKTAIVYDNQSITYRELNEKANDIAVKLIEQGVKAECFVALLMERSIEMIISMFGILKAGGAYVPMDDHYPEERIQYMLKDCKPKIVLVNSDIKIDLCGYPILDVRDCRAWTGITKNIPRRCIMSNLAYCIYTSGTTGKQKGVLIEHRGFYNLMLAYGKIYSLTENDVVLQVANYVFDQSVWDIFNILIIGGTLSLISYYDVRNPQAIAQVCNRNHVTIASFTPTMLAELNPDDFKTLRIIDSSGEAANANVLKRWCNKYNVINTYGPTEVTVNSSSYKFEGENGRSIPIGKPIANYKMYILNQGGLCGIGIPGELCIAGIGVARGYLNADELTQKKFVDNPFEPGRMYRTGDLARWLPDGNVEYLGRMDEQVKIRGYRIELGDIESSLRKIEYMKDCVVTINENKHGDKVIYGYIVSDEKVKISDIKYDLKKELPDYMIPSYIYQLERIPFTASGKVDRMALPKNDGENDSNYVAPRNELEAAICQIFSKLLDIKRVGAEDDFFMLGGHSLLAIKLSTELAQLGYTFTIKDIFGYGRVSDIARFISGEEVSEDKHSFEAPAKEEDNSADVVNSSVWTEQKVYMDGVQAYNEVFYKSCFYNALFAGIKYLGINPYDVMVQAVPSYSVNEKTELVEVNYMEAKTWTTIMEENKINIITLNQCDEIINVMKKSLREKSLLIIQIDGYYSPIREDLYGKLHWAHNILVYGFDDSTGIFHILEQSERSLLDYSEKEITYYDLENAFKKGLERFGVNPTEPPVVIMEGNKRIAQGESDEALQKREIWIKNIADAYQILQEKIVLLEDSFERYLEQSMTWEKELPLLLDNINKIIESKKVFNKLILAFIQDEQIIKLSSDLLDEWIIVRSKLARLSFSKKRLQDTMISCKGNVDQIANIEKNLIYRLTNQ